MAFVLPVAATMVPATAASSLVPFPAFIKSCKH